MTYNAKIHHEQGGSVLTVESAGSIAVAAGGTISGAGTISLAGDLPAQEALTTTSLIVAQPNGAIQLGDFVQVMFNASATGPSGFPFTASPGAVFLRSDGADSGMYINTSDGTAGSVWKLVSEL